MAEVILTNVTKVFPGGVKAVDNFNLHIRDGELLVLVGPSGCGKSTTLRMVAGLEEMTGGEIAIGGRVVNDVPPKDRDIAMVFQNYALYPHMNVYKNMAFSLKLRGMPRKEIDQRVRDAAKVLGIAELMHRKPKELSGGQRQRVAVGRAIVRHPKAFLFDEPLSNLDAKLRVEMRVELKRLHHQLNTTTIYVTHDQEEAMTLGDRIVVMKDGYIQQCGSPLEIYTRPANQFVAGFIGTPPMNFMSGSLEASVASASGGPSAGSAINFVAGGVKLRLLPDKASRLGQWIGKDVVLGLRPEAMSLEPAGRFAGADNSIAVTLGVIEPLGEKMDLFATVGDRQIVARVDAQENLQPGQPVTLHIDARKIHVFDPGAGKNLGLAEKVDTALCSSYTTK
jgi:multiple sugar transport system ATP-binding protein